MSVLALGATFSCVITLSLMLRKPGKVEPGARRSPQVWLYAAAPCEAGVHLKLGVKGRVSFRMKVKTYSVIY